MAQEKLPYGMGGAGGSNTGGNAINLGGTNNTVSTITQPITPITYPTKNVNSLGLTTNNRPSNVDIVLQPNKTVLEKLVKGEADVETIDVSSRAIEFTINVVSDTYLELPDIREITYPKVVRGADFIGYDVDFEITFDTINATHVEVGIGNVKNALKTIDKKLKLNVKDIITNYLDANTLLGKTKKGSPNGGDGEDKITIPIQLTPVNESAKRAQDKLVGQTETFSILFDKGDLDIPRSVAINRIVEGFVSQFKNDTFDDSKYLTHLLHLGNGDNKVITTWTGLNEAKDSSLILKLYEPLPTSVQPNQKVWITKIQANPIIETITLVGESVDYCPPLKGPNFSLEADNGIGFQVYDDLIASGSTTSTSLIQQYVTKTGIDTEKLNIEYSSGSEYLFENYVHYGSSEERIKNFWYKIELLETYQQKYNDLTTNTIELGYVLTEAGYVIVTESDVPLQLDALSTTAITIIESNAQLEKINNLIGTFDGFEMWLYTSTVNLAYPKVDNVLRASTTSEAIAWYNSAVNDASTYDRNNVNYLNNNLPEFIKEDYQNEDFMLFMDMLGHHFDVIWVYINALNKVKSPQHKADLGFSNDLMYSMLESLGWEGKKAYDSQYLWEYALGQYKDGTQKYQQSLKSANEEVWRRILNNLPYILKHKGTSRSLKAVMSCYGIPQSLLTIMEFGGPTDPTNGGTQPFTFDDRTAAINFTNSGEYIYMDWETIDGIKPNSVEVRVNLTEPNDYGIVKATNAIGSVENWKLEVTNTIGTYGTLDLYVTESWTGTIYSASTPAFNIFNDEYTQIVVNRTIDGSDSQFQIFAKESVDGRIRTNVSSDILTISGDTTWDSGSALYLGYALSGSMDEFRLWKTPLQESVIESHTLLPDATNGNHYSASTEDLWLRFDFEYPKDRTNDNQLLNVAYSTEYNVLYGTTFGFPSASEYPYQYTPYDRTVTAKVPSLGFNSADKIRFEEQTLVGDLSHKVRATQKAFDRAPIDSSRLGLFFSPVKELNMDIVRSFGSFNIDNYIGDPSDEYKEEYTQLGELREYYFERLNRNIYEYIDLVRNIDKSLFEVLEGLVPARAKISKGLLIEPHYLERSKTRWTKPTSEKGDYDTIVDVDNNVTIEGDNNQFLGLVDAHSNVELSYQYDNYDANVDAEDNISLVSDVPSYDSEINVDDTNQLEGDYPTYTMEVQVPDGSKLEATAESFGFEQIGMERDSLANAGFGLYSPIEIHGVVTKLDIFGNLTGSREQIYLIKEQYIETISTQTEGWPATTNDEQVKYEDVDVVKYKYKVTELPYGSTAPVVGNNVVEVTPLNGYFPTHYRYKNNLSQGLRYSFFEGSIQNSTTTPDGLDPVETFTTNPNILRVANTGRGSGEPILEVD